MAWSMETSNGNEIYKIGPLLVPYTRGKGLDLGAGEGRVFPHFVTVDSGKDYGGRKVADVLAECDDLNQWADAKLDFVVSSHLLEHIVDYRAALKEWMRVIKVGGHLCLYLPHRDLYPRIGQPGSNPDHKHDFCNADILAAMQEVAPDWTLVEDEVRGEDDEYSFFQVYRREAAGHGQVQAPFRKREKSVLVVRYGAFGDALQAASILPALKAQGWHITMNTSQRGYEVLRADPSIDAWVVQDDNQVPNGMLQAFWETLAPRYDRIINLCSSVEDTLLPDASRMAFHWPDAVRRKLLGANYVDFTHLLAEVPRGPRVLFHDTGEERQEAQRRRAEWTKGQPLVMLVLAGSSVHKRYPFLPDLIWFLIAGANVTVVTVGDPSAQRYELDSAFSILKNIARMAPEAIEPLSLDERLALIDKLPGTRAGIKGRWVAKSARLPIRDTMALAKRSDVVFGPETGVLNAVSMMTTVQKVIMLSHSSHENLTRDWPSTIVLKPTVPCYPCHRLHRDHTYCPMDKDTGMAACATMPPEGLYRAIMASLEQKRVAMGQKVKQGAPQQVAGVALPPSAALMASAAAAPGHLVAIEPSAAE